jgi:hypothetical protein
VKVQKFDQTITTISIYALISDSFKSSRAMQKFNARRINRALSIKLGNVDYIFEEKVNTLNK